MQLNSLSVSKFQDTNTEALFGTMDKTLRLLEMGFSENEISAAIEKYGKDYHIIEFFASNHGQGVGCSFLLVSKKEKFKVTLSRCGNGGGPPT